jgi:hypothetical protein
MYQRSFPVQAELYLTHVLPHIATVRFAHLCRGFPARSVRSIAERGKITVGLREFETRSVPTSLVAYPGDFTLITRTAPAPAPATLSALPSTRAIETRSLPTSLAATLATLP